MYIHEIIKGLTTLFFCTHMFTNQTSTVLSNIKIQRVDGLIGTVDSVLKGEECQLMGVAPLRLDCMVYCSNSCAGRREGEKVKVQDYVTFKYDGKVNKATIFT